METYRYFNVMGRMKGEQWAEVLFGSYDKEDCIYEIDAEYDSWKAEGFKSITIVSALVTTAPDKEVYPHLN